MLKLRLIISILMLADELTFSAPGQLKGFAQTRDDRLVTLHL